jgi:hypothetical protein
MPSIKSIAWQMVRAIRLGKADCNQARGPA